MAADFSNDIVFDLLVKIEKNGFPNLCRVCMCKNENMKSVFSSGLSRIVEDIQFCTGIRILANDGLPIMLCDTCIDNLSVARKFKTACLFADKIFRKIVEQQLLAKVKKEKEEFAESDCQFEVPVVAKLEIDGGDDDEYFKNQNDEIEVKPPSKRPPVLIQTPRYVCNICGIELGRKALMMKHKWNAHQLSNMDDPRRRQKKNPKPRAKKSMEEKTCSVSFRTEEQLNKHKGDEHGCKKSVCEELDKSDSQFEVPVVANEKIDDDDNFDNQDDEIEVKPPSKRPPVLIQKPRYVCNICGVELGRKALMLKHKRSAHQLRNMELYESDSQFEVPVVANEKRDDDDYFNDQDDEIKVKPPSKRPPVLIQNPRYVCNICGIELGRKALMVKHKWKAHKLSNMDDKRRHHKKKPKPRAKKSMEIKLRDPEDSLRCKTCSVSFSTKEELNKHNGDEHGCKKSVCEELDKSDSQFEVPVVANEKIDDDDDDNFNNQDDDIEVKPPSKRKQVPIKKVKYVCNICGLELGRKTFMVKHKWNAHQLRNMDDKRRFQKKNPKPRAKKSMEEIFGDREDSLRCNTCSVSFRTKEELNKHKGDEHGYKKSMCEICGKQFISASSLISHVRSHQPPTEACPHCDYKTCHKGDLIKHLRSHTGEKIHTCSQCPRSYATISNLYDHLRRVHGGKRQYHCPRCDKSFFNSERLKRHELSHDDIKSFECDVCHAQFRRRYSWTKHLLKKHSIRIPPMKPGRQKTIKVVGNHSNEEQALEPLSEENNTDTATL